VEILGPLNPAALPTRDFPEQAQALESLDDELRRTARTAQVLGRSGNRDGRSLEKRRTIEVIAP
jgi:hypothetical protein